MPDKSYVFEVPSPQDDTLEWRSYQNLVRGELARLGFREAATAPRPALTVSMRFTTTEVPVRVVEPLMSPYFYPSARFGYGLTALTASAAATGAVAGTARSMIRSGARTRRTRRRSRTSTGASCRWRSSRRATASACSK